MRMIRPTMILAVMAMTAAAGFAQQSPAPADADPVIVSAGSVTIRRSEFEAALKTLPAEYQQFATTTGKRQFAADFLRMKLLAADGLKAGLDQSPSVLRQLQLMKENLVAQAQVEALEAAISLTDAELRASYESRKAEYTQAQASHILIAPTGSAAAPADRQMTDAEAKAKAEDIHRRLVAGADFAQLAKSESDDTSSGASGGDLGEFKAGQMVPEFDHAVFALKKGELSSVVKTSFGYHLIKLVDLRVTPFEDVRSSVEQGVRAVKLQEILAGKASNATFDETYFGPPAAK
jgi:parvulin-like peptidyl-prolyl isomerase